MERKFWLMDARRTVSKMRHPSGVRMSLADEPALRGWIVNSGATMLVADIAFGAINLSIEDQKARDA